MRDLASLLAWAFVTCLAISAFILILLSPLIVGLVVQDGNASILWFAGMPFSGAICLAIMATIDERI